MTNGLSSCSIIQLSVKVGIVLKWKQGELSEGQ